MIRTNNEINENQNSESANSLKDTKQQQNLLSSELNDHNSSSNLQTPKTTQTNDENMIEIEYSSNEEDDEEGDQENKTERERYYTVEDYIKTFAKHSVIKNYLLLLEDYKNNAKQVNHYIIKMFRRLLNLNYVALFYQVLLMCSFLFLVLFD